jgi:hypothetical protein
MYIVLFKTKYNTIPGDQAIGPFDTREDAQDWGETVFGRQNSTWRIVHVQSPNALF